MANDLFNYVIKSPINSLVSWVDSDGNRSVVALPIASGGSFNRQVELQRLTTINCQGLKVTAARVEIGEDPTVKLTFGGTSLPLLGLRTNRRWQTATLTTGTYSRSNLDVPADGLIPAAPSGYLGHGVAEDAVSRASYVDSNGLSTNLTQGTFATFDATATPLQFAVGANGAMKFGQGLWGKSVSIDIPLPSSSISQLGNLPYTSLSLKCRVALVNLQVFEWVFPSVTVNPTGDIAFQAADSELNFFVNGSYDVNVYGKLEPC